MLSEVTPQIKHFFVFVFFFLTNERKLTTLTNHSFVTDSDRPKKCLREAVFVTAKSRKLKCTFPHVYIQYMMDTSVLILFQVSYL